MLSSGNFLLMVSVIYILLYVLDLTLKRYIPRQYAATLRSLGYSVGLFQIKWRTTAFNRIFTRIANWKPGALQVWFSIGAWISALMVIPAILLLVRILMQNLTPTSLGPTAADTAPRSSEVILQPVLPGVNLPLDELGYYLLTLLVCSIFHEAGHAIAAITEGIRVLGFGIYSLFILPAAFVDLPSEELLATRKVGQLRVFAAGVWHNVVLSAFAYIVLIAVPVSVSPILCQNGGAHVMRVHADSNLLGPTGLVPGDNVLAINGCPVNNSMAWRHCLEQGLMKPMVSYCISQSVRDEAKSSTTKLADSECCKPEGAASSLCFTSVRRHNDAQLDVAACLPVRITLEGDPEACNASMECLGGDNAVCMSPATKSNATKLLQLTRRGKIDFLFVGNPAEVYAGAEVGDYTPKDGVALPNWVVSLPSQVERLCHYVVSFSSALAVLNAVPCFLLDGQHMTRVLVNILLPWLESSARSAVTISFTIIGTILLFTNILVGVYQLL